MNIKNNLLSILLALTLSGSVFAECILDIQSTDWKEATKVAHIRTCNISRGTHQFFMFNPYTEKPATFRKRNDNDSYHAKMMKLSKIAQQRGLVLGNDQTICEEF
ncbi:hypothetical protein [Caedibacter taeniospiralis]|uniref:hypothetical protein n=1 Tax=Caedibacter taeniospiralis TaxID=28907 RepID=UPI000C2779F1|nr:hypothetical protein [Caedibacter taeniospiralis]